MCAQVDSLANSTSTRAAAASCAEIITIVTEIKTIVAANPENSTVNPIIISKVTFFQQVTTLTTKITSVASTVTCSDAEKTSLATSVRKTRLIQINDHTM